MSEELCLDLPARPSTSDLHFRDLLRPSCRLRLRLRIRQIRLPLAAIMRGACPLGRLTTRAQEFLMPFGLRDANFLFMESGPGNLTRFRIRTSASVKALSRI